MMTSRDELPPTGHALGQYLQPTKSAELFEGFSSLHTAERVASQVEQNFAQGRSFSLGIEDELYSSEDPEDAPFSHLSWDKYMMRWSVTDLLMNLYNNVAKILQRKYPESKSHIGFLAYSNMTLPPVRNIKVQQSLYAELAPIDFDPIHGMDDPLSPPRQEYKKIMNRWSAVMDGRLSIYDYDQGMLVWRDLPNPSHIAFQQDVQEYRRAGILGVNTESRMALTTTFTNLYLRARLLWNPDESVDALLEDFYTRFYGPAALPMKAYWSLIFDAWRTTIVTEHEYFIAPAIYTRALLDRLEPLLAQAENAIALSKPQEARSRNASLYADRMRFTRLSYSVIDAYVAMTDAARTEVDYAKAVQKGRAGAAARDTLTSMNPAFTTTKLEQGYAFWPGEIQQYQELLSFTNGEKGELIKNLPLRWAFRRDPNGSGAQDGLPTGPVDMAFWRENSQRYDVYSRKDYPIGEWEVLRTDLYAQAQGIRFPDGRSFTGHIWYRTDVDLSRVEAARKLHVRFPGLFNSCRLFLNGEVIATRPQNPLWWLNDYRFEWDVALNGANESSNVLALDCNVTSHFGGMFRRPFVYAALDQQQ